MTPDSFYYRVITGEQRGAVASLLRGALWLMSMPYAAVIRLRNAYYDRVRGSTTRADLPVISVGNLTTGGTGKTPMVIWILERLLEAGHTPAVLMRGYKSSTKGGTCCCANDALQDAIHGCGSDEAVEIQRRCPRARLVVEPDRIAGAREAVERGCDVAVMDDGFQHRRLARDLDVVLIDATNPFGGGMLPRGLGREPAGSLRRAGLAIITRADRVGSAELARLKQRVSEVMTTANVLAARHAPVAVCDLFGRGEAGCDLQDLRGRRAWLFAAVGNPRSFLATAEELGLQVVDYRFWPDHHRWSDEELEAMAREARLTRPDMILTTEKDAVKLPPDYPNWPAPLRVVRVGIEFLGDDGDALRRRLMETAKHPPKA